MKKHRIGRWSGNTWNVARRQSPVLLQLWITLQLIAETFTISAYFESDLRTIYYKISYNSCCKNQFCDSLLDLKPWQPKQMPLDWSHPSCLFQAMLSSSQGGTPGLSAISPSGLGSKTNTPIKPTSSNQPAGIHRQPNTAQLATSASNATGSSTQPTTQKTGIPGLKVRFS